MGGASEGRGVEQVFMFCRSSSSSLSVSAAVSVSMFQPKLILDQALSQPVHQSLQPYRLTTHLLRLKLRCVLTLSVCDPHHHHALL